MEPGSRESIADELPGPTTIVPASADPDATQWFRQRPVQVALGVGLPVAVGVVLGRTADPTAYRPPAACLAVIVVLAVFSGPWAALSAALTSTVVIDITSVDHDRWLIPTSWSQAGGLAMMFAAAMTIVVLVHQRERARGRAAVASRLEHEVRDLERQVAEDRFRQVLDSLPDMVTVQRSVFEKGELVDFVVELINHPDLPVGTGLRRDLVGRRLLDVLPELEGSEAFEAMVTSATTGRPVTIAEMPVTVRVPGETEPRFASVQVSPFGDGVTVVVSDVTERRRALEHIERVNEELEAAQHLAHIGTWRVDMRHRRLLLSDEAARIVGPALARDQEWTPGVLLDLLDPAERHRVADLIGAASGGTFTTETRLVASDGTSRLVSLFGQILGDDEPGGPAVWGTVQDLTDQRLRELALADSQLRLASERATVAVLQDALVPSLPRSDVVDVGASYLPAQEESSIGGDWFDAFFVGDDRLVLTVGDVAGHGVGAAALMAQLRNALRGISFAGHTAPETIEALNRLVFEAGTDEMATCVVGHLSVATGELAWVTAGHPPPLLVAAGATGASFLEGTVSPPLGALARAARPVNAARLEPGSVLVCYSDGLIERRGEHLDVGFSRLAERSVAAVRAAESTGSDSQRLSEEIAAAMVEGAARLDDLCVLVLRAPHRADVVDDTRATTGRV